MKPFRIKSDERLIAAGGAGGIERDAGHFPLGAFKDGPNKVKPLKFPCTCTCGCRKPADKPLCFACWVDVKDNGAIVHVDKVEHMRAIAAIQPWLEDSDA